MSKSKAKKIIVTGGSGYLGYWVRRYFAADDFSRRTGKNLLHPADLAMLDDYDVIIHMAANVNKNVLAREDVFTTNVIGTQQLLARLRPHQSLIFCSTKDVYGQHSEDYSVVPETCSTAYCGQGAYEWSKLIAEHYVQYYARQNGFQAAIFRLSTIYAPVTPGNNGGFVSFFVRAVQNSQPLQLKLAGQQRRDLLYVDDLAHAFEQFINSSLAFGCYNIGGGLQNSVTLHQLVELIANLVGKPANLTLTPDPVTEQRHYVSDCQQLWQELQWQPTISIAEGLSYLLQ